MHASVVAVRRPWCCGRATVHLPSAHYANALLCFAVLMIACLPQLPAAVPS